jgi:hypothetical protein
VEGGGGGREKEFPFRIFETLDMGGNEAAVGAYNGERRLRREDRPACKGRNWTAPCCGRRPGIADVAVPAPSDRGKRNEAGKRERKAGKREALLGFKTLPFVCHDITVQSLKDHEAGV